MEEEPLHPMRVRRAGLAAIVQQGLKCVQQLVGCARNWAEALFQGQVELPIAVESGAELLFVGQEVSDGALEVDEIEHP